jgi:hypothetical protein
MKAIGREAKLLSESMNRSDGNPDQLERGLYLGIDCGRTSPPLYSDKSWVASLDDSTLARELRALKNHVVHFDCEWDLTNGCEAGALGHSRYRGDVLHRATWLRPRGSYQLDIYLQERLYR